MGAYSNMEKGVPGLKFGLEHDTVSRLASGAIPFGSPVFVAEGNADLCYAATAAGRRLLGVAQFDQKAPGGYADKEMVNIITEGLIYVTVADAVDANKPVYLTAGGAFTDESTDNTLTPFFFRSSTAAAGLALVEVIK